VADLTGEIIDGRYQLNRIIDSGGMATIYAALDLRLDRWVAVKIMHPHLAQDENYVSRFIREAKAAAALAHPNIVAIQDQGWNQSGIPAVFIVMELIEGSTLRQYLNEQGSLPLATLLPIIKPVLSALSAAHRLGIIHRDIKPENILISKDGRVKIADFGLARGAIIGQTNTAESSVILGSVSYLAPEQVERGVADARSDIYSAAIVIFEALTGEKPFTGDDPVQVALKHVKERVPRLSQLIVGTPPSLDDLIYLATSSNPDDRPKDGEDFLQKLKSVEEEFNPAKKQMSLELDLPAQSLREKVADKSTDPVQTVSGRDNNVGDTQAESKDTSEKQIKIKEESSHLSKKNSGKKKKKVSPRVKRNRSIALALLISLIAAAWYIFIGPGTKITLPSVAGLTISGATNKITPLGVNVEIKSREFSEDIDEGRVIRSDPSGGGKVSLGGTVFLYVSQGKERYTVPTIAGLTPEAASALIENSNLKVGTVTERFSPDVAKGLILAQEPSASARVKRDSQVNFVISKGLEEILVKSYLGQSGEQALNELSTQGFDVDTQYQFSESVPVGAVINQIPTPNQTLAKGGKILLTISEGSEFVFIPNLLSLPTNQARDLLEDLSLKVVVKEIGSKREKVVVSVTPKVGDRVKRGSTVTITVS
jgi:serine/threonine-protein kinase